VAVSPQSDPVARRTAGSPTRVLFLCTHNAAALAIGATVLLDAMFGGPISGASMNPARSLGPAIVSGTVSHLWVHIAGPPVGALCGAFTFELARGEEPGVSLASTEEGYDDADNNNLSPRSQKRNTSAARSSAHL
jgi:hypothetical protein